MSNKTYCPACESCTSSLTSAFQSGWESCPQCGLSNSAWQEIVAIQRARDDDALAEKYREVRVFNDELRRENAALKQRLASLRNTVKNAIGDED